MIKINSIARSMTASGKFPYGIVILFMCSFSVFFSSPGQTYFTSVFVEHYINDFGWSRSLISSLYSLATLISGVLLMYVGRLADRFSSRRATIVAAAVLGFTMLLSSFVFTPFMLFAVFFLGRITGQGSLTLLPSTILPKWFIRKRAMAFSLMSLGSVAGSAILPPLNSILIDQFGWRMTWRIWALLVWLIFLPLVWLFLYDDPAQLGLKPDMVFKSGKAARLKQQYKLAQLDELAQQDVSTDTNAAGPHAQSQQDIEAIKIEPVYRDVPSWSLKEAMHNFSFWSSIYNQALLPLIFTGVSFHFLSIMGSRGVGEAEAPLLLSVIAVTSLPTTLIAGALLGRIRTNHAASLFTIILVCGLLSLFFIKSFTTALIFAILFGASLGLQAVWAGLVWPNYFGTANLGSIRGFAMTTAVIASALGPVMFGFIYDAVGTYTIMFIVSIAMVATGFILSLITKTPVKAVNKNDF